MARLFTHGRDYGPHAFVVQIRDIQTHLPLPGVTVGDIGAKMGYNGVDNGFLSFDHVTIRMCVVWRRRGGGMDGWRWRVAYVWFCVVCLVLVMHHHIIMHTQVYIHHDAHIKPTYSILHQIHLHQIHHPKTHHHKSHLTARENMLMRYAKVQPDGTYVPPPAANAKASYATMVYVRATIVEDAGSILARAATIAVRYNAVRRQMSPAGPGRPELQVIDYQNSAYILFPLVSSAYALFFMVSGIFYGGGMGCV